MSDRFHNDIELPDLPNGIGVPPPEVGYIQIYGRNKKLVFADSDGIETEVGGGGTVPFLNVDGGAANTTFQNYLLRFDFGAGGANINPTGAL